MKRYTITHLFLFLFLLVHTGFSQNYKHHFETVTNDPSNTLIYTLENGLKVYLSVNDLEPRVQTYIAVKAGSKFDPAETTGLAHYLEHMMFKGTHDFGTKNWEKEKVLLDQIAEAFEEHKKETNQVQKDALYRKIDSLSSEASKFAIANEYDKMISGLGAKGTNAYTSFDETVYVNDIPSNELEKWLMVEGNRFQTLVLRLFHTELETVYEEFNRSQDADNRWVYQGVLEGLFPNHPYGTQTTIGLGEHLKNPSMYNIHKYFDTYYVPNNVAICLSGHLDPDNTIDLIEKYFGNWKKQEIKPFIKPDDVLLNQVVKKETFGPQQEMVYVGFKFEGAGSHQAMMLKIMDMLLANSSAGLIDIDLNLNQKVLSAGSFPQSLKDYSIHFLYGLPKEGQTLEEVKDLLLGEVNKIKKGDFDDWLLEAVVNDLKLKQISTLESNSGRAGLMVDAFINDIDFGKMIFEVDSMAKISKQDIIDFANKHYGNNYVVSYKRKGESKRHSVPKPTITPVEVDRDSQSKFLTILNDVQSSSLTPKFIDFDKDIQKSSLSNVPFAYVHNAENKIFNLNYIFDIGEKTDKELALAIQLLPYLGTDKYSAEQLKKEFYRYGLDFNVNTSADKIYVSLQGLEENLTKGVELFEHVLSNVKGDNGVYLEMINDIAQSRQNAKLNKDVILFRAIGSLAKYGKENPFTDIYTIEQMKALKVETLANKIKDLLNFQHRIFYYGNMPMEEALNVVKTYHKTDKDLKPVPAKKVFEELPNKEQTVYYTHYDMQQVEMLFISRDELFNPELIAPSQLFNEYFGAGLSSIVFQEIREKKALAYSAYSFFTAPSELSKHHYTNAYIGTQADKLNDAVVAMFNLMNDMPKAQMQFDAAKDAVLKKLESDWTTGASVYWQYETAQNRGLSYDINKVVYAQVKSMTLEDLKAFFEKHIKGKTYAISVIGNENNMNFESLKKLGAIEKMSLEDLFGY